MTAKQRAARAKFKAVVAEAKKLRKKNPKLTQAQAVKQAFAISYSKKRAGVGAAPKKKTAPTKVKAKKGKRTSEMHTDTKSHNVNIRVMSGYKKIGNTSTVEVGDIFVCSWGYDQTNIDFYKVVKKTKTGVSIVPMSKKVIEYSDRYMTGKVLPGEVFVGSKPMRRKLNKYGDKFYISINSFSSAKKWSGMPETFTTYA
jgi:hypothetical protein